MTDNSQTKAPAQAPLVIQLREALERIAAIENQPRGDDWCEIDEAREIAHAALAAPTETDADLPTAEDVRGILAAQPPAAPVETFPRWCPGCSREVGEVCHHFNCAVGPNGLEARSRSSAETGEVGNSAQQEK